MRHNVAHKKFNRSTNQRKALLLGLKKSLIQHEKMLTTLPKAKAIRPLVERCITKGKHSQEGCTSAYRLLMRELRDHETVQKILTVLAPRFKDRSGGYLRITKAGYRYGDAAPMAYIQFV